MTSHKIFTTTLSLIFVLITGTMHLSYASHLTQHSHHTAAMHSTGACAWMCAAAHTISGDTPVISQSLHLLAIMELTFPESPSLLSSTFLPTRAPPR